MHERLLCHLFGVRMSREEMEGGHLDKAAAAQTRVALRYHHEIAGAAPIRIVLLWDNFSACDTRQTDVSSHASGPVNSSAISSLASHLYHRCRRAPAMFSRTTHGRSRSRHARQDGVPTSENGVLDAAPPVPTTIQVAPELASTSDHMDSSDRCVFEHFTVDDDLTFSTGN
jgi:hypothetical protein